MQLFDAKDDVLKKIDTSEGGLALTPAQLEAISGGYAIVSDPIYKLTNEEASALRKAKYKLQRTRSGNYRVYNQKNEMVDPGRVEELCNLINNLAKAENKTFLQWLFS